MARFDVDVMSGKVKVSSVDHNGRAVLTGGAVGFTSSDLLTVGGDTGKRHVLLTIQDNSTEGVTTGRVVISNLSNAMDGAIQHSVVASTTAGDGTIGSSDGLGAAATFQNPNSVARGAGPNAGSFFISDSGNHTIRRMWPDGTVTTFAGLAGSPGSADGNGSLARFNSPGQICVDAAGNVCVADTGNHTIRRITPLGQVSTIAGIAGTAGHNDGLGNVATFTSPTGIASSFPGEVFISEANDIRGVDYAGSGAHDEATSYRTFLVVGGAGAGYADGRGSSARFNNPAHIAIRNQPSNNGHPDIFVADTGNSAIRAIVNPGGGPSVITIAGANGPGSSDGAGTAAQFNMPVGIATYSGPLGGQDPPLFVSDSATGLIRLITFADGPSLGDGGALSKGNYLVSTLTSGSGFAEGDGTVAKFSGPLGIALTPVPGSSATLEIADTGNQRIRKLTVGSPMLMSGGPPSTIAEPVRLQNWDQQLPGQSSTATAWAKSLTPVQGNQFTADLQFYVPAGVSGFSFSAYLEADTGLVNLPGVGGSYITTLAGNGIPGESDGPGRLAQFNGPYGIARAPSGPYRAFVCDRGNSRIRALDRTGAVSTIAGSVPGFLDGPPNTARFAGPRGVAAGTDGSLYVADTGNRRIRRISFDANGMPVKVSTIAGSGTSGVADGNGAAARFIDPTGITIDVAGSLFVSEFSSSVIRKITYVSGSRDAGSSYLVSTIAGAVNVGGSTDGSGSVARFRNPTGIFADSDGGVYVADTSNHTIRVLIRTGLGAYGVSTVAGMAGSAGTTDGSGTAARFNLPVGLCGDAGHNLYVCELGNHRLRRISVVRGVSTIAGSSVGFTDGADGKFNRPIGLALEPGGDILVSDQSNHAVRTVQRLITDGQAP